MTRRVNRHRKQQTSVPRFKAEFSRSGSKKAGIWASVRRAASLLVVTAVLLASGYALLFANLYVEGMPEEAEGYLPKSGSVLFMPAFDTAAVRVDLMSEYREKVADVTIRHEWWQHRVTVTIHTREAALELRTGDQSLYVDREGVVVSESDDSVAGLPILVDQSNLKAEVGSQAVPSQLVSFVVGLGDSGLKFDRLRIIDTTSEVYADLPAGYTARFATSHPLTVQLNNLARIQSISKKQNHAINEYVDLRIPYKTYYR